MSKISSFMLCVILVASSLTLLQAASAAATPSVPQFSLKLVKHTFDSPPMSSIDPFTGQQTTHAGSQLEWITLDITITNQNFDGKTDVGYNSYTGIMYNIQYKGHFAQDWSEISPINGEGAAGPLFCSRFRVQYSSVFTAQRRGF